MNSFRWWLFKQLSWIGWAICPEPHRTNLYAVMPTWKESEPKLRALIAQAENAEQKEGVAEIGWRQRQGGSGG